MLLFILFAPLTGVLVIVVVLDRHVAAAANVRKVHFRLSWLKQFATGSGCGNGSFSFQCFHRLEATVFHATTR
uniref:Putative secreted protein n=1 Tax=Anopheles darlingi TaxID=43151 RepID=A0A2M4DDB5_ANODA